MIESEVPINEDSRRINDDDQRTTCMQAWISNACHKPVFFRALKIACLVGTLLMIINHGDRLLAGTMAPEHWLKVLLTYFVPYLVSTYSSLAACKAE